MFVQTLKERARYLSIETDLLIQKTCSECAVFTHAKLCLCFPAQCVRGCILSCFVPMGKCYLLTESDHQNFPVMITGPAPHATDRSVSPAPGGTLTRPRGALRPHSPGRRTKASLQSGYRIHPSIGHTGGDGPQVWRHGSPPN